MVFAGKDKGEEIMSETIGDLIDKLVKAEIRISEGYKEGNESLRDEYVKELNRRLDEWHMKDTPQEKIKELEEEVKYLKEDIEEQVKDLERSLERRIEKIES